MMKLQIANDRDRKEAQNRERRRQCELERRSRIFNARNRKIGVDVRFLERQVEEKRAERDEQERKNLAFAQQMIKDSNLAVVLEAREREERRRIGLEINEYRYRYQRPEDRREYDLNDPEVLKKQLPPRASDDNPVGLSSAQKFEGEDLNYEERKKIMAEQKNAWLEQQVQERKAAEEERKKAEEAYMMAIKSRDARASELDQLERECRYRLGQANLRYNEALAAERKQIKQILKEQEEADNTAEMYNNLTSDMLTENPDVAKSALGKNRAIGFMYKGMNQEELKKFYAAQKEQMAANKAKRDAADKMEAEWQALSKSIQREVARQDILDQRQRREMAKQLMEENQLLAMQQKEKEKYFKEVVYNNTPTDEYYSQFNTTTR
ncbi:PREDICTED: RIB43A-like with coiled-coils protein 2 [Papilio xuthus]|uniref:RIB43A-like with coiled-coils protein 2 n=2 Tax=Papilio xuthus TaxID=66420 RepID=A0A194Q5P9_PAPXU|nr:PREDICTED: RIB43A-like with coiled-coils protein 2 [Papilio xuthus]KPJ00679.1 RIB43A-like with coiled-coils protein 2 [Papilio xuthus]